MPAPGYYLINRTDPANGSFIIEPLAKNGPLSPTNPVVDPGATAADSTLLLIGKGTPNYGERLQENMLNVMENFSSPLPPVFPIRGQIWHNSTTGILMLFDGSLWNPANIPFKVISVGEAVSAGMLVNIYQFMGVLKVRPADAPLGRQADGFITTSGIVDGTIVVFLQGTVSGYSGLIPGLDYWLGVSGGVTNSPVQTENFIVQTVGKSLSATEIYFTPGNIVIA